MPSPLYCFPIVPSVMGISEHSYRGVFDREKKVSWGLRKQLHLCVLAANRTQVTEIRVFSKGSLALLQDLVHERCVSHFPGFLLFQPVRAPAQTTSSLQADHPLLAFTSNFADFQMFFPITTLQLHLASHTTALPVVPACFPSHYPMLYSSAPDQRRVCLLLCAKPFHITTDSTNTSSNSF